MHVPRVFQFAVLVIVLATGSIPQILQAIFNGFSGDGGNFALAVLTGLAYDLLRVAPLIVLARSPAGVLHPVIVAVVAWPLLTELPNIIDEMGGYAGLITGDVLRPPFFIALAWHDAGTAWRDVAIYQALQCLSLICLYGGFALARPHGGKALTWMSSVDTKRLRTILVGIILVNFLGVAVFIELRGGLLDHISELAFGRYRALAGLGPFLTLFDSGFICLLLWICFRPQDAKNPLFLMLLPLVAAQQFMVAGSRAAALMVVVLAGLGWALAAKKVPWRLGVMLLPVAFLSFGVLNVIRTAGLTNATAVEAVQDADFQAVLERSKSEFDSRQALGGAVPVVVDSMRTTGPMWGYTYSGAVFAMVPRGVWLDKPRGPGSMYAQTFLGLALEGAAVPIGPVAEAFWNFHVPGVVVLFAIYGMLLRRAYEMYQGNPGNGLVVVLFLLFATQFGPGTEQLVAFQQSLVTLALILVIVRIAYPSAFAQRRSGLPVAASRAAPVAR